MRDVLLIARPASKNNSQVTAAEPVASAGNTVCIPPGVYDVEISRGAITGTVSALGLTVQEQGYRFNKPAGDPTAWTPLQDPRAATLDVANLVSNRRFLRGVVIQKWNDGQPNAGIDLTFTGTGNVAVMEVTFWPDGRAPQYNGAP